MHKTRLISLFVMGFLVSACSLAPPYHPPALVTPEHYEEDKNWVRANTSFVNEKWWLLFNDPVLNSLEIQLMAANQDLRIAYAHYREAQATCQIARSELYPTLNGLFNLNRQQNSLNVANAANISTNLYNNFMLAAALNYEIDVWGRVRNNVLANNLLVEASAADLAAVALSLQTELAIDYFSLRGNEASQRVLNATVAAYKKALFLTKKRFSGGADPIGNVDQAVAQLENSKTLAAETQLKHAQLEHAIAILLGEVPANFTLPKPRPPIKPLVVARELPSTLLERRPDIFAARERVQAANAQIGVARAAFFPVFNFVSVIGFQSAELSNLLSKPSLFWSLGPTTALSVLQPAAKLTLFDGGKLRGQLNLATAAYHETVASYRQTTLTAFQEVEDSLAAIHYLDREKSTAKASTTAAYRALYQANKRYAGGITNYLEVIVSENTALQSELSFVDIQTRRQLASIQLIKALGGGWKTPSIIKKAI